VGREAIPVPGLALFAYSAERSIVDAYRLAHREGSDVANTALKRWLREPGHAPTRLLAVAESFPRTEPRIRQALEILP
jgi:hypothetical protein